MGENNLNSKIIGNAVSAYFMIFISGMFLFNKSNPWLNNDFVRRHTKSALIIHLGFFLTYIIFISGGFLGGLQILGFSLQYIFASTFCIVFLGALLFGVYKASKGEYFFLSSIIGDTQKHSFDYFETSTTSRLDERGKFDLILSYIPFVSFYVSAKKTNNTHIIYASRGTLFFTVITILLYSFHHSNLAVIFSLFYIIYVAFIAINIYVNGNIYQLRLGDIFSPEYKFNYTLALIKYCKAYMQNKDLQKFGYYLLEIQKQSKQKDKNIQQFNENLVDLPLPKFLVYIPLVNFIFIFLKKNKYITHIRNGMVISILFILSIGIIHMSSLNYNLLIFFLIITLYGIGYIHVNNVYRMPYIYIFYEIYEKITGKTKQMNQKYNVQKEITLKINNK